MDPRHAQFNPVAYSDVALYNIQAVAATTGVATITLRSWERRYGVPDPKRDPKGYRLYSERDIAVTRWLKDRVDQGVGISRAVNMLRALESGRLQDVQPRVMDFESLQDRLLGAIERLDESGIHQIIAESLMVATVEDVALKLLQPALYEVGERWARGELSVTSEHVGSHLIRSNLAQLVRISPAPLRSERILVSCAPGELHEIGALVLALFLRRRGFDVIYVGSNIEPESLAADIATVQPAAVCLSANTMQSLTGLQSFYDDLGDDFRGIRGFGGRIFNQHPDLIPRIQGLFLGENADEATQRLEAEFAAHSANRPE